MAELYNGVAQGFVVNSASAIDKRLLLTKAEMVTAEDDYMLPDHYFALCTEDSKLYVYDVKNEVTETGKYRALEAGIEDVRVDGQSVVLEKIADIDLTGKQDLLTAGDNIEISNNTISAKVPTKVSELLNDVPYVSVLQLEDYMLKADCYNKDEVNQLISQISGGVNLEVVATLPITGAASTIYLVRHAITSNVYDQYVWFNNSWVQVGSTEVDLSQYYKKDEVDGLLDLKQNKLVAGQNITITGNIISAVGGGEGGKEYTAGEGIYFTENGTKINATGYTAGDGIEISNSRKISAAVDDQTVHINRRGELYVEAVAVDAGDGIKITDGKISVDRGTVPTENELAQKQDKLIAGNNIVITGNVISATGGGSGGGANWGTIGGTITSQADLMNELNKKANAAAVPTMTSQLVNNSGFITAAEVPHDATKQDKLTAGANITISPAGVISATTGGGTGEVNWGGIKGNITDQADLQAELAKKADGTIGNGVLTIQKNGSTVGTFTANSTDSKVVSISVPRFSYNATTGVLSITDN